MDVNVDIEKCVSILNDGGLILYPTDTIWGIGCDAMNSTAVAKIYAFKKRAEEKSMIILVAEEKDIEQYAVTISDEIKNEIRSYKKPLTIIYPEAKNLAVNLISPDNSIAIRIVKDDFCKKLIFHFGKPIVSTSANISGERTAISFADISDEIKKGVDYITRHRREEKIKNTPSRIIKWTGEKIIIIRE